MKPRIAPKIAMIIGGAMISTGLMFGFDLGGLLGLIPGLFGLLGVLWVVGATASLCRRGRFRIKVDETGIEIPASRSEENPNGRVLLQRESITAVAKREDLKGRDIEIAMAGGEGVRLPIREYCELDDFLAVCRRYGLNTRKGTPNQSVQTRPTGRPV